MIIIVIQEEELWVQILWNFDFSSNNMLIVPEQFGENKYKNLKEKKVVAAQFSVYVEL